MRFLTPVIHPRDQEQALHNVNVCVQAGGRGFFPINHQMPCFQLAEIAAAARSPFPKARIGINVPEEHPLTAIPQLPQIDGFWADARCLHRGVAR
jgi:hypothetical protein